MKEYKVSIEYRHNDFGIWNRATRFDAESLDEAISAMEKTRDELARFLEDCGVPLCNPFSFVIKFDDYEMSGVFK